MQWRMLGDPIRGRRCEIGRCPADEVHDVRVSDHHALGQSGRSRREQDVGEVAVGAIARRRSGRVGVQIAERECRCQIGVICGVEPPDHRTLPEPRDLQDAAQHPAYRAGCEKAAAVAHLEHACQARRRARRIQRHIGGARLQHAEHGHDRRGHLRHEECDAIASPAAGVDERTRELVARLLELAIGHALAPERNGDSVRAPLRVRRDSLLQQHRHQAWQCAACSNTAPMCRNSSGLSGTSRMKVP